MACSERDTTKSHRPASGDRTARSACSRRNCATAARRRTAAPPPAQARRRSAARCCRQSRRAGRRPARRDRSAAAPAPAARRRSRECAAAVAPAIAQALRVRAAAPSTAQRDKDHAGKHEMRRQPILRDLDPVGEAGGDHPPADRALQRAESEDDPQPRAAAAARSSRATGTTGTAAGTPRRSRRPSSRCVHSHQIDRLELVERHAAVEFAVLRDGLDTCRIRPAMPLRSSGGTTPVTGFHSTIDRPESVSRVAPPTSTIAKIKRGDGIKPQPDRAMAA